MKAKKKPAKKRTRSEWSAQEASSRLRENPIVKARQVAQARKGKNRSNLA